MLSIFTWALSVSCAALQLVADDRLTFKATILGGTPVSLKPMGHHSRQELSQQSTPLMPQVVPVFAGGLDFSLPVKKFFYDPIWK